VYFLTLMHVWLLRKFSYFLVISPSSSLLFIYLFISWHIFFLFMIETWQVALCCIEDSGDQSNAMGHMFACFLIIACSLLFFLMDCY